MAQPKITFYVDIVSPFGYIAFYILKNSPVFKQCEITYVPILLGGLMKTCGNTPPLQVKSMWYLVLLLFLLGICGQNRWTSSKADICYLVYIVPWLQSNSSADKDKWIENERRRLSKHFNVPMLQEAPPGFPTNTLPVQRALVALSLSHPHKLESAVALFWDNFWVQWNDPNKPENMLAILRSVLGSDEEAKAVIERTKTEEVKKALSANTNKAFEDGAFGLPWFVATNVKGEMEGYWGVDHMGQLCDHLGLERPDGKGWRALL